MHLFLILLLLSLNFQVSSPLTGFHRMVLGVSRFWKKSVSKSAFLSCSVAIQMHNKEMLTVRHHRYNLVGNMDRNKLLIWENYERSILKTWLGYSEVFYPNYKAANLTKYTDYLQPRNGDPWLRGLHCETMICITVSVLFVTGPGLCEPVFCFYFKKKNLLPWGVLWLLHQRAEKEPDNHVQVKSTKNLASLLFG